MIVYLNGKLVPENRALVSVFDHGFLYGDGVYETLRVYDGKVFSLDDHLRRLKQSLDGIQLKPPVSLAAIGAAVGKVLRANRHKEAAVRINVARGPGPHGFDPRLCKRPTLAIASWPFNGPDPDLVRSGITAAVVSLRRNSPEALPPSIKSTSCLNGILAKMEAIRLRAHEGIFLSSYGTVAEGTVSNVFAIADRQIFTPVLDGTQLAGVTRAVVCRLARKAGFRVSETKVTLRDLKVADEVFITSSLMEVMPVGKLVMPDRAVLAKPGGRGPVTQTLIAAYRATSRRS